MLMKNINICDNVEFYLETKEKNNAICKVLMNYTSFLWTPPQNNFAAF